jgi:glutathione S-transferase
MQLLYSGASPFVRKVRVVIEETGLTDQVELVEIATTPLNSHAQVLAANPVGKIPTLIREEGPAIYDSRVICRYLDDRTGGRLYPATRIWETLTLEATADAILEAAVSIIYEKRFRPENMQFHDWTEAQWGKISRALDAVNDRWMGHLAGNLEAGQIAVGCALGYLDFRHDDREWRRGRDALDDWFAAFSQRQSMLRTEPQG